MKNKTTLSEKMLTSMSHVTLTSLMTSIRCVWSDEETVQLFSVVPHVKMCQFHTYHINISTIRVVSLYVC